MSFALRRTMNADTSAPTWSPASELVWDSGRQATALAGSVAITEGPAADWSPTLLLATAAGASLLSTFIDLAQRVRLPLLGVVTQQRAELDAHNDITGVVITMCITIPSHTAAADAGTVWRRALREAPVLRVLACHVTAEPSIVVVSDAACACEGAAT
jgi:hypothetical protein